MLACKAARAAIHFGTGAGLAALWGCSVTPPASSVAAVASFEDILVLRSERKERLTESTWCTKERAGFAPLRGPSLLEDRYVFWSVETRVADGLISNTHAANVGVARGCIGATENNAVFNFYIESTLGQITISGKGECTFVLANMPEKDLSLARCTVPLKVASDAYVGGLLVTSTMNSKEAIGLQTNPPGYTQPSIATIRLWRKH